MKNPLEKRIRKSLTKIRISKKEQDKMINRGMKVYMFISTIVVSIFFIILFSKTIYNNIGYERTTIILLTIIMIILRMKK